MSNRYLSWTLLFAACGLQACLVRQGTRYFVEREVFLPFWYGFSSYLAKRFETLPFAVAAILTLALPFLSMLLSWALLGMKKRAGWNLSLAVDLFFALPSLALMSINLVRNLQFHRLAMQNNPEVGLFFLAALHILLLYSPPIRTTISAHPVPRSSGNDLLLPTHPAR